MNRQGLTLMEVIIASLILAIAVSGVLFIFSTEKGVVASTGRRFEAMEFARQTLEELKDAVDARTWDSPYPAPFELGRTYDRDLPADSELRRNFPYQDDPPDNIMRRYTVNNVGNVPPDTGYKQVTVEVRWDEPTEP